MQTPTRSEALLEFARGLSPCTLRTVPVCPKSWAHIGDCVPNVQKMIQRRHGTMLLGWRFWEWPKVFLEAEFHAVWQLPDGSLQDPTPNEWGESKIRFVEIPDAIEPTDGGYPDNVLEPLNRENLVVELVEVLRKHNLARSHGSFAANPVSESKRLTLYEQVSKSYGAEPRLNEKIKILEESYR